MFVLMFLASAAVPAHADSATIVITAERSPGRVLPPSDELAQSDLRDLQPDTAAQSVDGLNGVSVRTNSRGEAVARVRGSEERQVPMFLDGAPLAVPWDGRADLGVLPSGLVGSVRVVKGAAPIEFGTNSVAGAVEMTTRRAQAAPIEAGARLGSIGFRDASAVARTTAGPVNFTLAAAAFARDGEPVAALSALPFSQQRSNRRTNSDARSFSLFGAGATTLGSTELRLSMLHMDARRGIAPEGDRNPLTDAPRYWRYPDISLTQLIANGALRLGGRSALKVVGWRQWFDQEIVQFSSEDYDSKLGAQQDNDDTLGGRALLTGGWRDIGVRLVATAQTSRHVQRDADTSGDWAPALTYRQNLYTLGLEADAPIGAGRMTLGLGYDRSANPRTGDKPGQAARGAAGFSGAYSLPLAKNFIATMSAGRRNRFPTARELFGEELGRFLPNSDLKPEQSWMADLELRREGEIGVTVNPFIARTTDTIGQRVVIADGRSLRQRYNLGGSTSVGLDASVSASVSRTLVIEIDASWLRARADRGSAAFRELPQRPSHELGLALGYRPAQRLSLRGEFRRFGPAADLGRDGGKAKLPPSNELNVRGEFRVGGNRWGAIALTGSVENLTDEVILPQLGLPLPGRRVRVGLRLN